VVLEHLDQTIKVDLVDFALLEKISELLNPTFRQVVAARYSNIGQPNIDLL